MLIVLLCRNTLDYSRRCLRTLLAQTVPVDILVVDNASSDGTAQWAASQQAQRPATIFRTTYHEPQSVAYAWNRALTWAWGHGHDEALVCNSDVELLPDTYRLLDQNLDKGGLITGVSIEREPQLPERIILNNHPDYSCFLVACWAHRQVAFDEGFQGAYFEDCDHHARLFAAGIHAHGTNLEFRHHRSGTLRLATWEEQQRINGHYDRNKLRFLQRYGCLPWTKGYNILFQTPPCNSLVNL